jgi:hypothetical protein
MLVMLTGQIRWLQMFLPGFSTGKCVLAWGYVNMFVDSLIYLANTFCTISMG